MNMVIFRKSLVFAIIGLFIGISISPGISESIKDEHDQTTNTDMSTRLRQIKSINNDEIIESIGISSFDNGVQSKSVHNDTIISDGKENNGLEYTEANLYSSVSMMRTSEPRLPVNSIVLLKA